MRRAPSCRGPLLAAFVLLTACQPHTQVSSATSDAKAGGTAVTGFAQFSDVPIPDGAKMDLERTLILGSKEKWIGRLALTTGQTPPVVFDLFQAKMAGYGWTEVAAVRSETSVLTFQGADRVATVQIQTTTLGTTLVDVTMAPRGAKPATN
jgi:hypothetical protein